MPLVTAADRATGSLARIDALLSLALRHHDSGKVPNLLGPCKDDQLASIAASTESLDSAGTTHLSAVAHLRVMQAECRDSMAELRETQEAGKMQLQSLWDEVFAQREAEQRAAMDADRITDNLSKGLFYVAGTPLVIPSEAKAENPAAVFFEGTSFTDGMLSNLGLFLTKHPVASAPLGPKGDLYRPTTQDYEEVQELRWIPSEVALTDTNLVDEFSKATPTRIQIGLVADTIMNKHSSTSDKELAVREQGNYCKSCLAPLKKSFNPLKGWDGAIFCYYSGYYYCENCHRKNTVSPLPALIVRNWDFTPKPISDPVRDFLEVQRDNPIICISAINPQLYTRVPILYAVRRLRVEILALHTACIPCKNYRHTFFESGAKYRRRQSSLSTLSNSGSSSGVRTGSTSSTGGSPYGGSAAGPGPRAGEYETFVPISQRYLAMDSEFWSLNDLIALYQADPSNSFRMPNGWERISSMPASHSSSSSLTRQRGSSTINSYHNQAHPLDIFASICPLIKQLLEMRRQFLRHAVKECVDYCLPRTVHVCPACQLSGGEDLVFSFDEHNRHACKGCHSYYHAKCWRALGIMQGSVGTPSCPVCYTIASSKKGK